MTQATSLLPVESKVDGIFQLLESGSRQGYIGENISQLEHALQAALRATQVNADDETVLAALLHDIGQFCSAKEMHRMIVGDMDDAGSEGLPQNPGAKTGQSVGIMGHEKLGAEYLRRLGFSSKVCNLVESHVVAKRYLTAIDQKYYESLSNASKLSLKFQGGPFSPEDAAAFETDPLFKEKVQLRKWDDASKVVDLQTPGLDAYRAMAIKHLGRRI